jgi:prophage regulatory protein
MESLPSITCAFLNRQKVVTLVGLCYTTIYNLEKRGKFPARRKLSPGRVGWLRSEVEEWLLNRELVNADAVLPAALIER